MRAQIDNKKGAWYSTDMKLLRKKAFPKRIAAGLLVLACLILTASFSAAEGDGASAILNGVCTTDMQGFCNKPERLCDNDFNTRVKLASGASGAFLWTDGVPATLTYWEWTVPPASVTVSYLDADGNPMGEVVRQNEGVRGYLNLPDGCRGVRMTVGSDCELSEWHMYDAQNVPETVHLWEPEPEKCSVMLVVAHSDDELVMMGGIVPAYSAEMGANVQVVYCYVPERERVPEALNGLWYSGMRTLPVFFVIEDENNYRFEEKITEQIRRFRPEVVITHDPEGEYGNPGHILVSREVQRAVESASDAARFPASAETWGTWQVKKLYLHLYPQNQIRLDFDAPLAAFGGRTAFEIAQEAYAFHTSQRDAWLTQLQSNRYDCRLYGLKSSTVGEDVEKNDFLENIPLEFTPELIPTPSPTPEPTDTPAPTDTPEPTPTLAPTAEPTAVPVTAEPTVAPEADAPARYGTVWTTVMFVVIGLIAVVGIALAVVGGIRARNKKRRKKRRKQQR